jgi:outer membrane protein assembly factor BamB
MKKAVRISFLVAAGALLLSACAGGEPAPSSFPGLTIVSNDGYLASNLHVHRFAAATGQEAWRFPITQDNNNPRGPFAGQPVKLDNLIIVGGTIGATGHPDNHLYALSELDGSEAWRFSGGQREYADGVATDGKLIFAPNGDHTLYTLDPTQMNGAEPKVVWTFTTANKLWAKPAIADGKVYLPSLDHNLYALDAATGKELWRFTANASIASTPALKDGVLYFGSFDQNFYAINAADGKLIWKTPVDGWVWCDALVDGNEIFFGDAKGKLYALDANKGQRLWTSQVGGPIRAQPVVEGNKIYVVSYDSYVYSYERQPQVDSNGNVNGTRVLENGLGRRLLSTPAVHDGLLLVPLFDGEIKLIALNLENNQKQYEFPPKPTDTPAP